jgi:hypothetical protein
MKAEIALVAAALIAASAPAARAADPLPRTGEAKLAAYTVCRTLMNVDMGKVGSQSSAECEGIVKSVDGPSPMDNLAIRCLEESRARTDGYRFDGTCVETDADGDKLYLTYQGPESGPLALIGGSGKYSGITGEGAWTVADAPGNNASLFAFTLSYSVKWSFKPQ